MDMKKLKTWRNGRPGNILFAKVSGFRDGGIIYRVNENFAFVPNNFLSPADYKLKPELGTEQFIILLLTQDSFGKIPTATRRGEDFVSSITKLYFPQSVSGIWMGASNSWAVIRMHPTIMGAWLSDGGKHLKAFQKNLGLTRITLVPESKNKHTKEVDDIEIKHFVNNAWQDCKIEDLTNNSIVIRTPQKSKPSKLRTFKSMAQKFISTRNVILL